MTSNTGDLPSAQEPVRRRYPAAPLVGVAVAVFDHNGRVLLVQRGRPPGAGDWGLPGGLLELGESLSDGVRREVREECGIEIEVGGIVGAFEPIQHDSAGRIEYHYVVIDFWANHTSGDIGPADDALATIWSATTALERYQLRPDTRQIILDAHQAWSRQKEVPCSSATTDPNPFSNSASGQSGAHA